MSGWTEGTEVAQPRASTVLLSYKVDKNGHKARKLTVKLIKQMFIIKQIALNVLVLITIDIKWLSNWKKIFEKSYLTRG